MIAKASTMVNMRIVVERGIDKMNALVTGAKDYSILYRYHPPDILPALEVL
jgi:hypothetical protein